MDLAWFYELMVWVCLSMYPFEEGIVFNVYVCAYVYMLCACECGASMCVYLCCVHMYRVTDQKRADFK